MSKVELTKQRKQRKEDGNDASIGSDARALPAVGDDWELVVPEESTSRSSGGHPSLQ